MREMNGATRFLFDPNKDIRVCPEEGFSVGI